MTQENDYSGWSTKDEKAFIDGLGSFAVSKINSRINLLIGYKKSYDDRINWGNIIRASVEPYLDKAIEAELRRINS